MRLRDPVDQRPHERAARVLGSTARGAPGVAFLLGSWNEARPEFVVGGNEAGMILGGDARGADAAVWRSEDASPRSGKFRRKAPVLAVEIEGEDEAEAELRQKARWYLDHGVSVSWLVLPHTLEVLVVDARGERRLGIGETLAERPELPGLVPSVAQFFVQLRRAAGPA